MRATYVAPTKTPLGFEAAAFAMRLALTSVLGEGPTAPVLALALGKTALETGRWSSMWNGNFGNVKASDKYEGFYTAIVLNEVIGGKVVWFAPSGRLTGNPAKGGVHARDLADEGRKIPPGHPQTRMRAFTSAADGALDYVRFVAGGRYAAAWGLLLQGDAPGYVSALKKAGYFTADEATYAKGVISLQREFIGKLAALPTPEAAIPPPEEVREWLTPQDLDELDAAFAERGHQAVEANRRGALREMSGGEYAEPLDPLDEESTVAEPRRA
jgi:hypothetical protein